MAVRGEKKGQCGFENEKKDSVVVKIKRKTVWLLR